MKRKSKRKAALSYEKLEERKLLAADLITSFSTQPDDGAALPVVEAGFESAENSNQSQNDLISRTDVVLEWNNLFSELLVENVDNQNPGYASRAMAMLNLAIYDAVTITTGEASDTFYDYASDVVNVSARVSPAVAAAQAAYTVLSSLYAEQQPTIDSFMNGFLSQARGNAESSASLALGTAIGSTILEARADDGSDAILDYTYEDEIGSFQADPLNPNVPVWGPAWGQVDTFSITSAADFVPDGAPALDSEAYANSYNEVLALGGVDSEVRTADQTEAGIFWAYDREGLGTPIALFNDVLQSIAVQQGNSLQENAALFAQASVAMADAGVVAWQSKFSEEFWRPVTAIHQGDNDGNSLTEGDTEWTALGAPDGGEDIIGFTPQFPTYVSGHATFGGALFGAIQQFYGTDEISFDLTSQELEVLLDNPDLQEAYGLELDDATRSFDTLSEAMAENGRSRVYLGIHFDFDDLVGQEVGQAVAAEVSSDFVVAQSDDNRGDENRRPRRNDRGPLQRGPGPLARTGDEPAIRRAAVDLGMGSHDLAQMPTINLINQTESGDQDVTRQKESPVADAVDAESDRIERPDNQRADNQRAGGELRNLRRELLIERGADREASTDQIDEAFAEIGKEGAVSAMDLAQSSRRDAGARRR